MIYDYKVTFETGTRYVEKHADTLQEATEYYNTNKNLWDYGCLRKRTMDPVTLKDVYEDIAEWENTNV